ncbi:phosphoenolpyruvate--protein phosphotransferase [Paraliomyxa miuraensis]|uniref:phosphoenolpyruvate--protein phosphotransferase n=1 Tax=Paraliomyxa miuraensis TaxID=376150 RepID=UPI00225757DA|nr:phosphoenolpyruvate--protein phosphotransferase [Paraliomyxa miuraensis]MCX4245459.1 phosphoenolpyruvate--protein phosphotransferase [Paraliomyxa miuraensis]
MSKEGDEREPEGSERRRRFEGIAASPGVAIGPAYVVDRHKIPVPRRSIDRTEADAEVHRFRKGLRDTQAQLEQIKARLPHGEHRQILKAQQLMLRDPDMATHVEQLIREEHLCAEWALSRVADEIRDTLQKADDQYFRERSSDMTFLAERVLLALRGEDPAEIDPPAGAVVVAHDLPPADTAGFARTEVVGMVTAIGGQTSHSAIVARSLEIPAVVGVDDIDQEVEDGDTLIVDAIHGVVVVRPSTEELEQWEEIRDRYERFEDRVQREHGLPASGRDGTHVTLRANVALEAELGSALFHGAEGVGLYRTEFMFMDREVPPSEEEHYRLAKNVLRRVAPYPVVFRTFDLGSDKPTRLMSWTERERNPAMGLRSLRLALREREMFLAQLRGLLRAAVHGPLRIMLPLVSGLGELRAAYDAVAEARRQLADARIAHAQVVPVGIMIEMPSAAIMADLLAPHVDFMSIGTNDLIQYTLAIDRDNDDVGYLYRPLHPSILRLIKGVAQAGREHGISVSLCGEMAADPRYTWVLAGLGVRELSMHPSAIPVIKNIIRGSDLAEMEALAQQVLEAPDVDEAERLLLAVMRERFPEHLQHGGGQPLHGEREAPP